MKNRPYVYNVNGYRVDANDIIMVNPTIRNLDKCELPERVKLRLYLTDKYINNNILDKSNIGLSFIYLKIMDVIDVILEHRNVKYLTVIIYTDSITFKTIRTGIRETIFSIKYDYYSSEINKSVKISYINNFDDFKIGKTKYTISNNGRITVYEKDTYNFITTKISSHIYNLYIPLLYEYNKFNCKEYVEYQNWLFGGINRKRLFPLYDIEEYIKERDMKE